MKARLFVGIFIFSFSVIYILVYLLYFFVDPEQIFAHNQTEKKYFYTKDYSRYQYEKLKYEKSVLVFGTSQIHMLSSKMMGKKVLNFHNLYGESGDILNFLQQLDKKQLNNIEEIIYLIDLRAIKYRLDENLIDYSQAINIKPLELSNISRLYDHFMITKTPYGYTNPTDKWFLNPDGSIEHPNETYHIGKIFPYPSANLVYNENTVGGLLEINNFALSHNLKISFITPVVNEMYFKSMNLKNLSNFYTSLLDGGIREIKLLYYIEGISDLKNDKLEYIAFMEKDHINQHFFKNYLKKYILTDNEYTISNKSELMAYINRMILIQNRM